MALEGQHANIFDFFGHLDLPLICDLTGTPTLLHQHKGPVSFILSRFARISLFDRLDEADIQIPGIPPLGSVGIAALHAALMLTPGPVYFTGLDFSFQPGKTHARSTPPLFRSLNDSCRIQPLLNFNHGFDPPVTRRTGKRGEPVLTTPNLEGYAAMVSRLDNRERLVDSGQSGLPPGCNGGPPSIGTQWPPHRDVHLFYSCLTSIRLNRSK